MVGKLSLLKYNYFYSTDYVCPGMGGQNLGWIPDFCLRQLNEQREIKRKGYQKKCMCIYHI